MYYMTFTSYAPEGAVALREGDKGVILDELISLESGTGTGTDEFGRKYKQHWFALASYDNNTGAWTYFGKNSTTEKYIGWTYVVAWYDKDQAGNWTKGHIKYIPGGFGKTVCTETPKGKVIETVTENSGVISIYDERWEARADHEIPVDSKVEIVKNESLVMFVKEID